MPATPNRLLRSMWSRALVRHEQVDKLDASAWQRGLADVDHWALHWPIPFTLACAPMAGAFGVIGTAISSRFWVQVLLGAVGATLGIALSIALLVVVATARAPYRQRNEARQYAKALEAHVAAYVQWARRREIAEDLKRQIIYELLPVLQSGHDKRDANQLRHHWVTSVNTAIAQLRDQGAGPELTRDLEVSLAALDAKDDAYGDNEMGRIVNSMSNGTHNLWSTIVRHDLAPSPPTRPGMEMDD